MSALAGKTIPNALKEQVPPQRLKSALILSLMRHD